MPTSNWISKGLNEYVWLREEPNKVYPNVKLKFGKTFPQRFGRSQECLWGMLCVSSKCWNKFCWLADESVPKHQRVSQQQPAEPRPEPEEAGQSLIGGGEEGGEASVRTRDGTPATRPRFKMEINNYVILKSQTATNINSQFAILCEVFNVWICNM